MPYYKKKKKVAIDLEPSKGDVLRIFSNQRKLKTQGLCHFTLKNIDDVTRKQGMYMLWFNFILGSKLGDLDACLMFRSFMITRAVHILPNRFVGTVGEHNDFPVERMRLSRDGDTLASCSHDQTIKFWDVSHLKTMRVDPGSKKRDTAADNTTNDFFADL